MARRNPWIKDLRTIRVDLQAYERKLDRVLVEHTKKAARIWLAEVVLSIPVWSKASRATFEHLAQAVGFTIPYGLQLSRKNRHPLGVSTSSGGIERGQKKGHVYFYYKTNLRYLAFNEANRAEVGEAGVIWGLREPGPYNFIHRGQQVFLNYAANVVLPPPRYRTRKLR